MTSLYQRLGGEHALDSIMASFCTKLWNDERLAPFFTAVDRPRLCAALQRFLRQALGGPGGAQWDLRARHAEAVAQGLHETQFDAWMYHWSATLQEHGVDEALIARTAVVLEGFRREVQGRG